jgi:hypothetical protein
MAIDPLRNPYAPPTTATQAPSGTGEARGVGACRDERRETDGKMGVMTNSSNRPAHAADGVACGRGCPSPVNDA